MMPRWILPSVLLSLTLGSTSANALTLIYTNDVLGEIEPCGCRSNPMGGMLRKAGLLEKLKKEGETQFLQVDAGDFLFESTDIPPALAAQSELQASYLIRAHELLGHQVVTPGEKDFALGVKTFQELISKSKIQFLSANLLWKNKPLLKPSTILRFKLKNGTVLKIGVVGVMGEKIPLPSGLSAGPIIPVLEKQIAELKKKVDRIIILSHEGYEEDLKLAKAITGIDLIVGAHSQTFLQTPETVGTTQIVQSSYRNQYVGIFPLDSGVFPKKHDLIGLDPQYEEHPVHSMKKLVQEFKSAVAKLNAKAERKIEKEDSLSLKNYQTFTSCVGCHETQFEFWRKTNHARALTPLHKQDQLKNLDCLKCHSVGFSEKSGWKNLGEIAFLKDGETKRKPWLIDDLEPFLKQMTEAKKLDIPVKLTRKDQPLPLREALGQIHTSFAPVQCENCHGPAGEHPFSGAVARKTTEKTCVSCHTVERAPQWYNQGKLNTELFSKKLKSVACPSG